jgi:hypothetical protein
MRFHDLPTNIVNLETRKAMALPFRNRFLLRADEPIEQARQ